MTGRESDVVILGAGPAGLTAAIYASRAAMKVLVIEGEPTSNTDLPGGQLMLTTDVENYPGFPNGVLGPELISNLRTQATRFGAQIVASKVNEITLTEPPFTMRLTSGDLIRARAVIIATGSTSRRLGLADEDRLLGRGVSTCATCDGFFFRGHDIAIVGGGDSALEEAIFLTKFARSVKLIHRRDELRASKIMQQRAIANDKIQFVWSSEVVALSGEDALASIQVRNIPTGQTSTIAVTGLFLAIGHNPTSMLVGGQLATDEHGYIRTDPGRTSTSVAGVFACGDVQDPIYRQAITSAGSGCMAAIDAERWLQTRPPAGVAEQLATAAGS